MKTISHIIRITPILMVMALAVIILLPQQSVLAQQQQGAGGAQDLLTPVANNILATVQVLVTIVFTLALVAFGWGIVQLIFAAGDPAAVQKAKTFLLWGVIGMAVMASIFGLISFLRSYFGVSGGPLTVEKPKVQ